MEKETSVKTEKNAIIDEFANKNQKTGQLKEMFKTRQDLVDWIFENEDVLKNSTKLDFDTKHTSEEGIWAKFKWANLDLIIIIDFKITDNSLDMADLFLNGDMSDEHFIGAIIIGETYEDVDLDKLLNLRQKACIFGAYDLKIDEKTNKPLLQKLLLKP